MEFKKKVANTISNYNLIEPGDKLVLGVSGGPDSMAMLNSLLEYNIVVAHVNHGLRENAVIDEKYVEDFCSQKGIEYHVLHANIKEKAKEYGRGLEDTGRIVRYSFFDEVADKVGANKIVIAHNMNDRVETIIMNLIRGTGTQGLKGIELKNGKYIRPLLLCSREEIEKYCEECQLNPRHDETNDENDYTRNKIRNIVIPYIKKEFNPNIEKSIIRLSDIVSEDINWMDDEVDRIYNEILISKNGVDEIIINRKKFNALNKAIQKRVILKAIIELFGTSQGIEKIHIDDIIKLCNNNIGNKYLTPNKNTRVELKNKQISITKI